MTTHSERAFHDWLGENLDRSDDRSKRATWLYCMLLETGELRSIRVRCLTYRCAQGRCAVLDVFEVPGEGLAVGFPRYKTSPQPSDRASNESGRAKNTEDGWRRWRRWAIFADSISSPPLLCDHLREVWLAGDAMVADWDAGHTEVRVRRDGSRYAVKP